MVDKKDERSTVDEFVLEKIDTVPEIEALLLIWNKRPKVWSVSEMASALYISPEGTQAVLRGLKCGWPRPAQFLPWLPGPG